MSLSAFLSQRVVTPQGIREAAVLVEDGRILDVVPPDQLPAQISVKDFGEAAILPGLVDSHVNINEPGRTEWEGFRTATRAAAAGGCTLLVDMPLNCLPATTTQQSAVHDRMRVWEAMDLFSDFYPNPVPWEPLLEQLGLTEKRNDYFSKL